MTDFTETERAYREYLAQQRPTRKHAPNYGMRLAIAFTLAVVLLAVLLAVALTP